MFLSVKELDCYENSSNGSTESYTFFETPLNIYVRLRRKFTMRSLYRVFVAGFRGHSSAFENRFRISPLFSLRLTTDSNLKRGTSDCIISPSNLSGRERTRTRGDTSKYMDETTHVVWEYAAVTRTEGRTGCRTRPRGCKEVKERTKTMKEKE